MEIGECGESNSGIAALVWDSYHSPTLGEFVRIAYPEGNNGSTVFKKVDIPKAAFDIAGLPKYRGTRVLYDPLQQTVTHYVSNVEREENIKKTKAYASGPLGVMFSSNPDFDNL